MNYWEECLEEALHEAELKVTPGQLKILVEAVEGSHENYGMYMGHDVASENLRGEREREKDDLRKEIEREKDKVTCQDCNGTGNSCGRFDCIEVHELCNSCIYCRGAGRLSR